MKTSYSALYGAPLKALSEAAVQLKEGSALSMMRQGFQEDASGRLVPEIRTVSTPAGTVSVPVAALLPVSVMEVSVGEVSMSTTLDYTVDGQPHGLPVSRAVRHSDRRPRIHLTITMAHHASPEGVNRLQDQANRMLDMPEVDDER